MFSVTFGRFKFLVRKYIHFWHQQAKDSSCGLQLLLSFLSSFMSCVGLSLLGLFWFCFVCFLSKGHIHCLHPTRRSAVRLCCAFSPGLQSQWIAITVNCNGLSTGKMLLSTKGLGAGGRFTHVDWAAGS